MVEVWLKRATNLEADGGTNAASGVVPELTRKVYDLSRAGRHDEAMQLQFRLLELFDTMVYSAEFPEGFRAAATLRGFNFGRGRQPQSESQTVDNASLQNVLHCILADFGFTDQPPTSCPPRTGDVDQDRIAHIAQGVIHELRQRGVL